MMRMVAPLSIALLGIAATAPASPAIIMDPQSAPTAAQSQDQAALLALPPRDWAVAVSANEITALHHPNSYLRYHMHIVDEKGDKLRDVIESRDGTVARLIKKDGRPLTKEEDDAERSRLNAMVASPGDYAKHVKNDEGGRKIANDMIKLMPDAMIYTYVPGQPQAGEGKELQIVLDYKPNPKWSPPNTMSEALKGLEGRIWIDAKSKQLVRMEGHIFQPVNFGWGVLAHIYPGGKLVLEQSNAGGSRWIFTHFTEQVSVRTLMVKTINVNSTIDSSNIQTLPGPMSYQDAVKLLLDTPLPAH